MGGRRAQERGHETLSLARTKEMREDSIARPQKLAHSMCLKLQGDCKAPRTMGRCRCSRRCPLQSSEMSAWFLLAFQPPPDIPHETNPSRSHHF